MEKEKGFLNFLRSGMSFASQYLSDSLFLAIVNGIEGVLDNVEDRVVQIEKRITRRILSAQTIFFGGMFLAFALFFFITDFLGWPRYIAFLSEGVLIFIVGLFLKMGEHE